MAVTDIVDLAKRLYRRIEWQNVPDDVTQEDLAVFIVDAIRFLYVITGRSMQFSEEMFTLDNGLYTSFDADQQLDEREYVLVTAEINFYKKVQTGVSDQVSYTTDAMSVSHGDKPFANLEQKILDLSSYQRMIWYKMIRYNML